MTPKTISNSNKHLMVFRKQCAFKVERFLEMRFSIKRAIESTGISEESSALTHKLIAAYWLYFAGEDDEIESHRSRISELFHSDVLSFKEEGILDFDSNIRLSNARTPETTCPEFIIDQLLRIPFAYREHLNEVNELDHMVLDAYCEFVEEKIQSDEVLKSLSVLEEFLSSVEFSKASEAQSRSDRIQQGIEQILQGKDTATIRAGVEDCLDCSPEPTGEEVDIPPEQKPHYAMLIGLQ